MSTNSTYPSYRNRCGWNEILPPRTPSRSQRIDSHYDFVVVGAGFTGLSAARRLAELNPDKQVLVVDATVVGEGSSGRNSGFLISLPHNTKMSGHHSPAHIARKQMAIYESGLKRLEELVTQHTISCGWNAAGKYHAAATDNGIKRLKKTISQLRTWDVSAQELTAGELEERTGSAYYKFGFKTLHNVFVQPAALIRGLADTLPPNVVLRENCPAVSIDGRGPYTIKLADTSVTTTVIVLANNGFAKRLGFFKDRLITIYTYAALTPRLNPELLAQHGSDAEWGIIPANRLGTTLRKTHDGRFMVRSAYSYEQESSTHSVRSMLTEYYQRRYPSLKSHDFEYVWGGTTALTRNGATFFGNVSGGIYASLGCNGAGVLKGTAYGQLLAEMIMGGQSSQLSDALALEKPSWLPPEPLRQIAVKTAIKFQKSRAGLER